MVAHIDRDETQSLAAPIPATAHPLGRGRPPGLLHVTHVRSGRCASRRTVGAACPSTQAPGSAPSHRRQRHGPGPCSSIADTRHHEPSPHAGHGLAGSFSRSSAVPSIGFVFPVIQRTELTEPAPPRSGASCLSPDAGCDTADTTDTTPACPTTAGGLSVVSIVSGGATARAR